MTIETLQASLNEARKKLHMISNIRELTNAENLENFLDKEVKETFKETYSNINFSGWRYDIETDGKEIWLTGALSQGSQSMESRNGETIVLCHIPMVQELPDWFNVDLLTTEQKEKIAKHLNIEIEDVDYWANAYDVEVATKEIFPTIYNEQWDNFLWEEWENKKDNIKNEIDSRLNEIEEYAQNEVDELLQELEYRKELETI